MLTTDNLKDYLSEIEKALENDFQRKTLDTFATAYRTGRANAFAGMDIPELVEKIASSKDDSLARMDELYQQFKEKAEALGVHVHLAADAEQANEIIAGIARANDCRSVVKSKSMTAEEIHLNTALEKEGLKIVETDLGEWIIQLRKEPPSHMVLPAIHLSRFQVADLFENVTGKKQETDIYKLVKVARRELRKEYVQADMGISGANFAVAETGSLGLVTNEGNARLVTTFPRVHVALVGLEKLAPKLKDALLLIKALPRNATGQQITSYVTWLTGPSECLAASDGQKEMHIVFLDNGRRRLAKDRNFSQILRCIRCGACANVCPVYRLVGGHKYGYVYIGAVGLVMTYFFHGREKARLLVQNCINCGACKEVCVSGIDLPALIKDIHARILDEEGHPPRSKLLAMVMKNRRLFHMLLKNMRFAQLPFADHEARYVRHLPSIFMKGQDFRKLPVLASTPFRDRWKTQKPSVTRPKIKVGLFSGCAVDFIYPEQMEAAVKVMSRGRGIAQEHPETQTCCGLPAMMMGEQETARETARQNLKAFASLECDYIVTLCASCAAHLKHNYPRLLGRDKAPDPELKAFTDKIIDFSSFVRDVMRISPMLFNNSGKKTGYHAPCHLCRGLEVREAPRANLNLAHKYVPTEEEEVCCGFGGSYSLHFPAVSRTLLAKKMANLRAGGVTAVGTDCPGCVMQIRGGMARAGMNIEVKHVAELMAEQLK